MTTTLVDAGVLSAYYGYATFARYAFINDGGPYSDTTKTTEYDGWIYESDDRRTKNAELVERDTFYGHSREYFESYTLQRATAEDAYNF